jgi:HEPN domain-containing protein
MTKRPEEISIAEQWLRFAQGDLSTARVIANFLELPPRNACYLAQQSAEKALKATLIYLGIELIKTHDLDALVQRMPEELIKTFSNIDLSWLSEWCVEARYPGDWVEASQADATKAVALAERVLNNADSILYK